MEILFGVVFGLFIGIGVLCIILGRLGEDKHLIFIGIVFILLMILATSFAVATNNNPEPCNDTGQHRVHVVAVEA